mmetsp:Transcript_84383/g.192318  ORF Transcript_84383/g.192318 Transcript_84383/m.192318 type:complete len:132 (+) Transcript_84383:55-450(+)|eukprot:CAMPEP_0204269710 /NCGR_PEP_ID=MMETSP0468-20130131/16962_1 /ASSEMBLY_ACC=CAM_ASM_000383 /TAXON_ID=2969 /ORGANISM="Oxyrrhis marina" /LENGTH=131 /DNA_ID=CAMNT_0051245135 /DNA_START=39 /DNA_END=434 /DNA_ORIENTATION=+
MRLLTHNLLVCNKKGVKNGFPLKIVAHVVTLDGTEFQPEFVKAMYQKLDWAALRMGLDQVRERAVASDIFVPELPPAVTPDMLDDDNFLRTLHLVMMDLHVEEGTLVCPESGREFPVSKGIPNMLLHDDEV